MTRAYIKWVKPSDVLKTEKDKDNTFNKNKQDELGTKKAKVDSIKPNTLDGKDTDRLSK